MASAPNDVKNNMDRFQGSVDAILDNEFHRVAHALPGISKASAEMLINAARRYLGPANA